MASVDWANLPLGVKIFFSDAAKDVYEADFPAAATSGSAGFDLRAAFAADQTKLVIEPGERCLIPTGISIEPLRDGVAGFVYSRSGLGAVKGLTVAQGVGVIDPDYRGEILVSLLNTSPTPHTVRRGERIAQLIFQPFFIPRWEKADRLGETMRGAGGFGHTGQ
ncbi:deoxyuridine 5'-triphosphate nucleotidohydrolase [Deltaproteobacteria bacterium]|nr:deoxyuridine 5'-triphosphate nucleotidohydrolase [Deltaproteobacteria bacterium]